MYILLFIYILSTHLHTYKYFGIHMYLKFYKLHIHIHIEKHFFMYTIFHFLKVRACLEDRRTSKKKMELLDGFLILTSIHLM